MSKSSVPHAASRIHSLDILRGFFIVVIVLDHFWKYPSLWSFITGQGLLWVTAAEGFVMISGFLIGYIRGYKGLKKPFRDIATILLKRAVMLYVWMLIAGMGYLYIEWNNFLPAMPYTDLETKSYWDAFVSFATTGKPHVWIHFLYIYSIFLILAIGAVALLRKRQSVALLMSTLILYLAGTVWDVEWMKWQVLFFVPSIVGFYFEPLRSWWHSLDSSIRFRTKTIIYTLAAITIFTSAYITFSDTVSIDIKSMSSALFSVEILAPIKVVMAGLWFVALAFLFDRFTPAIQKYTYGALEYIGQHSLTAYIIHGYAIVLVNLVIYWQITNEWRYAYYTLLGLIILLVVYGGLRVPLIRRIIPR